MSGIKSQPALAARVRLQMNATTGQPVLLYPEGIIELNATAHDILVRCDGKTIFDEILAMAGLFSTALTCCPHASRRARHSKSL